MDETVNEEVARDVPDNDETIRVDPVKEVK
jgi:hypothetical protein